MISTKDYLDEIKSLKEAINEAEAVIIGAGAGLSAAAGFVYTGERFDKYFADFIKKYNFPDMYFGGFHSFETKEEFWAYWSRYIYVNRYMDPPKNTYHELLKLVSDKDYFVITTNVDHCFRKAGFDKKRLFYTQGDYGLFQCSAPCHKKTYDNEETMRQMVLAQGFIIGEGGNLSVPKGTELKMTVPSKLLPICPVCGRPMTMNLRSDGKFVEDKGWHKAAERYEGFIAGRKGKNILFLEIGVGYNTPGIIKYPFWRMTYQFPDAKYACISLDRPVYPDEIKNRTILIEGDADRVIRKLNDVK